MIEKKGITLIALVITIIVLLILAGITISLTIGQDGIIKHAQKSGKEYQNAQEEENRELNNLYMEMIAQSSREEPSEYIDYLTKTVYPEGMPLVPTMTTDECAVGKATASSNNGTRTAGKAFDHKYYFGDIKVYYDIDNSWQSSDNGEGYIQFEFNRPVIVNRIEFIPTYVNVYGGLALKTAKLQLSNDGVNFIDASELQSYSNNINVALTWNEIESNDKENAYKYVRLYVNGSYTSSYGTGIAIREMQIYGRYSR